MFNSLFPTLPDFGLAPVFGLTLVTVAAALAVIYLLDRTWNAKKHVALTVPSMLDVESPGLRFLFDETDLIMASREAQDILATRPKGQTAWEYVLELTSETFPELLAEIGTVSEADPLVLRTECEGQPRFLRAEMRAGLIHLSLDEEAINSQFVQVDQRVLDKSEAELSELRSTLSDCPAPIWRELEDGTIVWANRAYRDLCEKILGDEAPVWPYPRVFDTQSADFSSGPKRLRARDAGEVSWFTCHQAAPNGAGQQFYAFPAQQAVDAEQSLQSFVTTLTDTFSHLSTGLAIFDRDRRLTLFNPALVDQTGLDPAWASGRPTLGAVLDRMRELRMVPEPKDYKSWRDQIVSMEQEARQGNYREEWSLPDGRTLRVTGRPHPRGALALLFEDITPELSQTRRYRAELELGTAVLDGMEDAIVVFSRTGTVLMANSAYVEMWGQDPNETLEDVSVADCTRQWSAECAPSPAWGDLRDFVCSPDNRAEWSAAFARVGHGILHARFQPLPGGGTLVAFRERKARSMLSRPRFSLDPDEAKETKQARAV